jgi:HK97 family phage major capsid protein
MTQGLISIAVKALDDDGRIGGYLVIWGNKSQSDLQGEYFTPETDLGLDWYPRRPVLYHHGIDRALKSQMIGQLERLTPDETGVWVEGQLDLRNRWARAVWDLVKKGVLGWSSGSLPHLVDVARDGQIKRWPIVEGSLTPTPAEPRGTNAVDTTNKHFSQKAEVIQAYKSAGLPVPDLLAEDAIESDPAEEQAGERAADAPRDPLKSEHTPSQEDNPMSAPITLEQLQAVLDQRDAQKAAEREQADLRAKAARADELEKEVTALKAQKQPGEPARRLPGRTDPDLPDEQEQANDHQPVITVGSKFDNLDVVDLAFGAEIMRSLHQRDAAKGQMSEQYANALAWKAWQAGVRPYSEREQRYYKNDELSHSTLANYGDEWVPDIWNSELWRKARQDNVVLPLFRSVEMPSNPFELPIEGTDPTVYYVPETTNESQLSLGSGNPMPDSQVGSGKVTLSAKKLALRVGFSAELVEDSIIPILPLYREQALRKMADSIDYVLLNGDVETGGTGNINSDDQAPTATDRYLAFNGLRKLPLVTTTAQAVDAAAGGPTLSLLRSARFKMPHRYSLRVRDLAWVIDGATYGKLLSLNEVATIDKFGPQATVMTGEIGKVDGIPVLASAEMSLTEADGKLSYDTPANNIKGQAVCVYRPGWIVGYRRRIATSMEYIGWTDSYQMVATVRVAFVSFDAYVSSALYNIGVS